MAASADRGHTAQPVPTPEQSPIPAATCRDRSGRCRPLATFAWQRAKAGRPQVATWLTESGSTVKLVESQPVTLAGMASVTEAQFGAAPLGQGPLWVSLAAGWCQPCMRELADVVAAAGAQCPDASRGATCLMLVVAETGSSYSLLRARTDMLAQHATLRPDQGRQTLPTWVQYRSDLLGRWPAALAALAGARPEDLALPVNAVFDRCGNLWDMHQGLVTPAIAERFAQRLRWARRLDSGGLLPCAAAGAGKGAP